MSAWYLDPTLFAHNLNGSIDQQESLSTYFSLPHHPAEKTIPQTCGDLESRLDSLEGHGMVKDAITTPCFEYVVVGGSTAGLALASRLAEGLGSGQHVCVVEAGKYCKDAVIVAVPLPRFSSMTKYLKNVPGAYGIAVGDKDYDWSYHTVPQTGLNGRKVPSSVGRLLGGSSGINYLARTRASSPEYDAWDEFGSGWDWNGLLPYFKSEERYEPYDTWGTEQIFPGITKEEDMEARREEPMFRGHCGPVHSTHNAIHTDLLKPTVETIRSFGVKTNRRPGYGNSTGIFNADTAVNRAEGVRSYAANAYLRNPNSTFPQPNLVVLKGVYATEILFDSDESTQHAKAVGVTCLGGVDWKFPVTTVFPFDLKVSKEIIVSAGAYNSPRLLELSGIGNPTILSQFNIPTVVDLPVVGENLQEHALVVSDFIVKEGVFTLDRLRNDPTYKAEQEKEYRENRTGAYATSASVYGFIKFQNFLTEEEVDELKTELEKEISKASNPLYKRQLEIQREYCDHSGVGNMEAIMVPKVFASTPRENTSYITLLASLPVRAHAVFFSYIGTNLLASIPSHVGSVHISSSDPLEPPSINPRYLNNLFDTKILTKATQFVHKLSETAPLKDIIVAPSTPGPEVQTYADFENYVRNNLISIQHPIGTAAMAPKSLGGVVDSELRVYGTQNVRVVDMSIAPLHLVAHPLDTAYAIGEKASDLIKASRKAE